MITYEQAKVLTEGQVVYTIKENKIKEAKLTCVTHFEARKRPPSPECVRLCYKLKGGTVELVDWVGRERPGSRVFLTKEAVAEAMIQEEMIAIEKLEKRLAQHRAKIEEAKKFGGLN